VGVGVLPTGGVKAERAGVEVPDSDVAEVEVIIVDSRPSVSSMMKPPG